MTTVYRVIAVIAEIGTPRLVYCHAIKWLLGPLDYQIKSWIREPCKKLVIQIVDIEESSFNTLILNNTIKLPLLPAAGVLTESFENYETIFLEKSSKNDEFNPLIRYCAYKTVYFKNTDPSTLAHEISCCIDDCKQSLQELADKYGVDLIKHPELIGTFSIISPTRVRTKFKGFRENGEDGFKFAVWDEFDQYPEAVVDIISFHEDRIDSFSYKIGEGIKVYHTGFIPDRIIVNIMNKDELIHNEDAYIIKNINIHPKIKSRNLVVNGKTIETFNDLMPIKVD